MIILTLSADENSPKKRFGKKGVVANGNTHLLGASIPHLIIIFSIRNSKNELNIFI